MNEKAIICPTCNRTAIKLKPKDAKHDSQRRYCDYCLKLIRQGEKPTRFVFKGARLAEGINELHKKYGLVPEQTKPLDGELQ